MCHGQALEAQKFLISQLVDEFKSQGISAMSMPQTAQVRAETESESEEVGGQRVGGLQCACCQLKRVLTPNTNSQDWIVSGPTALGFTIEPDQTYVYPLSSNGD